MGSDIKKKTSYPVMLSSTYKELEKHREAVREAMLGQRLMPIAMEDDAALPIDLIDASLAKVEESDAYVGLISYRYGQVTIDPIRNPEELSLTELEFRRAVARKIPICMFIMHDKHDVPREAVGAERGVEQKFEAFVQLAKKDRIYAEFKSVDDLKAKAVQSLVKLREILERSAVSTTENEDRAPRHALTNIPINVPRHFLGRDEDLAAIEVALKSKNGRAAITALHGLRGVGKTTLAAAYAERHRGDYRATWWIRAETESTMRADLAGLGVRLGWVAADEKEEPALATVMERLRDEGERILLVYDNANSPDEIRKYLPRGGAAHVVVTSNAPNWGGVATRVEIEIWPNEIGADYLITRTGRDGERAAALELAEALGGLPLAHEQAAAYCERLGISFANYLTRFEAAPVKLLDSERDAPAEYHDRLTVAKTFALAIDEAAKLHPAAESLIVHAALLAPEPIPLYLFSEAREEFGEPFASTLAGDGLDEAVATLRAFALIDRETIPDERDPSITTDCIRLHRLVRQVAATRRKDQGLEEARRVLIAALAAAYPKAVFGDPKTWPRARRLDAIILPLVENAAPPKDAELQAAYLLDRLASYRQVSLFAYAQAGALFKLALTIHEKTVGSDHLHTADSLNNLGYLLQALGDLVGARRYYERALAIFEKMLGPDHPDTATSLRNLGSVLHSQGDLAGARSYYERALAIHEKTLGPDHPGTATSLSNLGSLLQKQGDFAGARPHFERALAIHERALGPDHPDTALILNNLGGLLRTQGDLAGARPYFERALAIHERALGPDHPDTATSLDNLGGLLLAQDDLVGARPCIERALAIREKALGPHHPDTANSLNNLGSLQHAQGDPAGARPYFERALGILDKVLGAAHPTTKTVAENTAGVLEALKRQKEAKALRKKFGIKG